MTGGNGIVHIGCYTAESGGRGVGIVAARRDPVTGALEVLGAVATTPSPSFLARHPSLPVLYAANELDEGLVTAWTVRPDGSLGELGVPRSTGGAHPCHLAVAPGGRALYSANYGSGSVCVHPLDADGVPGERSDLLVHDGRGPDPQRQERAHAHLVSPEPDGGGLLAVDLGTDSVYRYELDPASGRPRRESDRWAVAAGTGPRHLARHPDGRCCYLVGELTATVTTFEFDAPGRLRERGRVAASTRTGHVQPSEIVVGPDGRFLYVANRGSGTVSVFTLDGDLPRYVTEVETGGEWPRHFALIGSHLYVADERAHAVAVFAIDPRTGVPSPTGEAAETPSPTCVLP